MSRTNTSAPASGLPAASVTRPRTFFGFGPASGRGLGKAWPYADSSSKPHRHKDRAKTIIGFFFMSVSLYLLSIVGPYSVITTLFGRTLAHAVAWKTLIAQKRLYECCWFGDWDSVPQMRSSSMLRVLKESLKRLPSSWKP